MANGQETRDELLTEVTRLRRRVAQLEAVEAERIRTEQEYRSLLEASPDAVMMSDLEGRLLFASPQSWNLLGFPTDVDPRGWSVLDHVIEEDRSRLASSIAGLIDAGVHRDTEYQVIRHDGTPSPVELSSAIVRDSAGRPQAIMAVVRDIAQRKRAERALRASEEWFRAAFEEAPVGMMTGDKDRKIFRVNRALCRMMGHTPQELIGKNVQQFVHPEDREISAPLLQRLLAGEIPSYTVQKRYIRKSGETFWAQATTAAIPGPDGKPAFALGVIEDIGHRKRAQVDLERERQTLWHMLQSSDHERQLIAYDIHDGLAQQLAAALMQFQSHEHLREHDPTGATTAYDAGVQMLRQAHFEARRLISGVRPPILDESGIVAALAHLVCDPIMARGPKIELHSDVAFGRLAAVLENVIYRIAQEAIANACKHSRSPHICVRLLEQPGRVCLEVQDWGIGFDPERVCLGRFGLEGMRERARLLGGEMTLKTRPGEGTCIRVALPLLSRQWQDRP